MRKLTINMIAFAFFGGISVVYGVSYADPLFWWGLLCLGVVQVNSSIGD